MRRVLGTLTSLAALLVLVACNNPPITVMDTGPRTDTPGGGTDTPVGRDTPATATCGTVGAGGFPPLPAGCMPRCSTATLTAYNACPMDASGNMCRQAALDADTTATATVDIGMGMTQVIDCTGCTNWQINSCIYDSCTAEFTAYAMCAAMGTPETAEMRCPTEVTALNGCIMTNLMALQTCAGMRGSMCFGATMAARPGERAPEIAIALDAWEALRSGQLQLWSGSFAD
jgi:hypothetical protein